MSVIARQVSLSVTVRLYLDLLHNNKLSVMAKKTGHLR